MSKSPPAPVRLTLPRPSRDGRAAPGAPPPPGGRTPGRGRLPGAAPPPPPSPADLQTLVAMRARPRPARLRVGFVECNTGDLTYFRRLLEREVGAPIRP